MRNENWRKWSTNTQKQKILKICACFYTELYSSTLQGQTPHKKIPARTHQKSHPSWHQKSRKPWKKWKTTRPPGIDNLTSDVMIFGAEESVKQITKIFIQILETNKIPVEWKEAKKDFENYRSITLSVYFPKCTNCSHWYYKNEWKRFFKKTKRTGQFQKRLLDSWSSSNNQSANELNKPLCIRHFDYQNAFDSTEHEAIFKALRVIGIIKWDLYY